MVLKLDKKVTFGGSSLARTEQKIGVGGHRVDLRVGRIVTNGGSKSATLLARIWGGPNSRSEEVSTRWF